MTTLTCPHGSPITTCPLCNEHLEISPRAKFEDTNRLLNLLDDAEQPVINLPRFFRFPDPKIVEEHYVFTLDGGLPDQPDATAVRLVGRPEAFDAFRKQIAGEVIDLCAGAMVSLPVRCVDGSEYTLDEIHDAMVSFIIRELTTREVPRD